MGKIGKQIMCFIICMSMLFQIPIDYIVEADGVSFDEEAIMNQVADSWLETCDWLASTSEDAMKLFDGTFEGMDFSTIQDAMNSVNDVMTSQVFTISLDLIKEYATDTDDISCLKMAMESGLINVSKDVQDKVLSFVENDIVRSGKTIIASYIKNNFKYYSAKKFSENAQKYFKQAKKESGAEKAVTLAKGVRSAIIACEFAAKECDELTKDEDVTLEDLAKTTSEIVIDFIPVVGEAYNTVTVTVDIMEKVTEYEESINAQYDLASYINGTKSYDEDFIRFYSKVINQFGDYQVTVNEDGSLTLGKYLGYGRNYKQHTSLEITNFYQGSSVSRISSWFAEEDENLTSVTIQDSYIEFCYQAFYKCPNLSEVNYNVTYANHLDYAICDTSGIFYECGKNKNGTIFIDLNIGEGVKNIPPALFMYCQLSDVIIPEGVTSVGELAFYQCSGIGKVVIPTTVEKLSRRIFSGCNTFQEIQFNAKNATHADNTLHDYSGIFYGCGGNYNLVIGEAVEKIPAALFMECAGIRNVSMGNSVKEIGSMAFYRCGNLSYVEIPKSVERLSEKIFYRCNNLTQVKYNAKNAIHTSNIIHDSNGIFYECWGDISLDIGEDVESIPAGLFMYSGVTEVVLPEGVISVGTMAFYRCGDIAYVEIPESVQWLSRYAFRGCTELKEVKYNARNAWHTDTIITDTSGIFDECKGDTNLIIGERVETVPPALFMFGDIKSLRFPSSVVTIGKWPFLGCPVETVTGYSGTIAEEYARVCKHGFISLGSVATTEPEVSQEPDGQPSETPGQHPDEQTSEIPNKQPSETPTPSRHPDEQTSETPAMQSSEMPDTNSSATPDVSRKDMAFYDIDADKTITLSDAQSILKFALKISASDVNYALADAQKALKVALKIEKFY